MTSHPTSLVQTKLGEIQGRVVDSVYQFLGVPYAKPPTGERRFRAPEPLDPWDGVLHATRLGSAAPQPARQEGSPLPTRNVVCDEDCLFLNIYSPGTDTARRPVLVWIHGGSYTTGSGNSYNGASFATEGDIVVVALNYRLGALGFMELGHLDPELAGSQNNGIRDQIAALQWVHEHIEQFGGDPDQVTISGESAGAGSVVAILASPSADHLYHQAISQSAPAAFMATDTDFADAVIGQLGGSLDDLRAADAATILDAQSAVSTQMAKGLTTKLFGHRLGGLRPALDSHTITRTPIETVAAAGAAAKPLLIGTNSDEGTLFSAYLRKEVSDTELRAAVADHTDDPDAVIGAFAETYGGESNRSLMTRMLTDTMFRTSSLQLADAQTAAGGATFVYLFTWASEGFGGRLGAMHALEIPFVWNQDITPWAPIMGDDEPWPDDLADRMHRAWTAFIHTGNPSHDGIGTWPAYNLDQRPTMEFGDTSDVLDDPLALTRAAWV